MLTITARNVNYALTQGLALLRECGVWEESRNGPVLRAPVPVTTVLTHPTERVLFHDWRDANPFFHAVEACWMLAGRDDLKALTPYVAKMMDYSDDGGVTQPGAYGKRWRGWERVDHGQAALIRWSDQIDWAVRRLRENNSDRRVVIQMWDPAYDIPAADHNGADVPCNLTMLPWVQGGALHLTIFNRSNDIIWGLYGANAVHFSTVLEYLAGRLRLLTGTMTTVSNNFHAYKATLPSIGKLPFEYSGSDPYSIKEVNPYSLYHDWSIDAHPDSDEMREKIIQQDLRIFFEHGAVESATKARWPYLKRVVVPLALAHKHWKGVRGPDRYAGALEILDRCEATDWRLAAQRWVQTRKVKYERTADDGVSHADAD